MSASEAGELLKRLIRFDTVNPPGNERPAQGYLAEYLKDAGFQCELLAAEPQRPNLVARLRSKGSAGGPTLGLLGHIDTVLADPSEWRRDPWSGEEHEGFIWGRGALDMKSQVAAEVAATAALARGGWRPARGELLVIVTADEEASGIVGANWLTANHPDQVRCDMLINEGGGHFFEYDGVRHYGVGCAEKGIFRFTVTTHGVAGHASLPALSENALLKMAPLLERLAARRAAYELTPQSAALLSGLGIDGADPDAAAAQIGARAPQLWKLIEPLMGVTLVPTKIRASEKINVVPSSAEIRVDCRVPPGLGEQAARRAIAQVLGDEREGGFEVAFTERMEGNGSPVDSPLMDAIREWVSERDPAARVVPTVLTGFSDSHAFRVAFPEAVVYGFCPARHQSLLQAWPLIHGADERIDARDVAFAAEFFGEICRRLLG